MRIDSLGCGTELPGCAQIKQSITEIRTLDLGTLPADRSGDDFAEIRVAQVGIAEISSIHQHIAQIGRHETGALKHALGEDGAVEVAATEVSVPGMGAGKGGVLQILPLEIPAIMVRKGVIHPLLKERLLLQTSRGQPVVPHGKRHASDEQQSQHQAGTTSLDDGVHPVFMPRPSLGSGPKALQIPHAMTRTTNPLLLGQGLPSYGQFTPEAIGTGIPELLQQLEAALARHEAKLVTLEAPTWEQVMNPLHHIEERLRWAWGVVNHLTGVCDSDALRQVHCQQQPAVVRFYNRLGQSRPLYNSLGQLQQRHRQGALPLNGVQQRILTAAVQAMELQGVGLEPEQRQEFNAASTRLAELSTSYSNHVLDATNAWSLLLQDSQQVDGLPESLRELMAAAAREAGHSKATAAAGPWQLGLDLPRYGPFLRYSRHQQLREQVYRAYVSRASTGDTDNHPLIRETLTLRHQQAQRLGYNTWAQVSLVSKMAGSVDEIEQLLEELRHASQPATELELQQLGQLAKEMDAPEGEDLKPWDVSYWSEQLRRRRFDLDSEALRPWFPLEQVLEGLFGLCERLFAIRVLSADGEAPTWHKDVRFFRVVDQEHGTPMAAFYLDPYARPGQKRGGAWMDECLVRQRNEQGQIAHPVAYLICNQTPPVNGTPSLMTFMDVRTLFHEFGHGLQHMLTTIDRPQAAGLNLVEDDAIELASQFMENWCYDQPTIMAMARHWQTKAPLPESEFQKIKAARTFMAGTAMLRQLSFAQGDLTLHARWQPGSRESPEQTWRRIATAMAALPPIADDATICSFEHLFAGGYAAGYYSYKWSEVLSADAFAAFEEVGLENEAAIRALGKRYRDTVLSLGGGQHAGEVFHAFRGREPSTEALLRHSGLVAGS